MSRVIVVGGGLSGLSAAHTLYERGSNVLVLDKVSFSLDSHSKSRLEFVRGIRLVAILRGKLQLRCTPRGFLYGLGADSVAVLGGIEWILWWKQYESYLWNQRGWNESTRSFRHQGFYQSLLRRYQEVCKSISSCTIPTTLA